MFGVGNAQNITKRISIKKKKKCSIQEILLDHNHLLLETNAIFKNSTCWRKWQV